MFGFSVSLDGFMADKNDGGSEVFAWMDRTMEHFFEVAFRAKKKRAPHGVQTNSRQALILSHRLACYFSFSPT